MLFQQIIKLAKKLLLPTNLIVLSLFAFFYYTSSFLTLCFIFCIYLPLSLFLGFHKFCPYLTIRYRSKCYQLLISLFYTVLYCIIYKWFNKSNSTHFQPLYIIQICRRVPNIYIQGVSKKRVRCSLKKKKST